MGEARDEDEKEKTLESASPKPEGNGEAKKGIAGCNSFGSLVKLEPACANVPPGFEKICESQYGPNLQTQSTYHNLSCMNSKDITSVAFVNQESQTPMTMTMFGYHLLPISGQPELGTTNASRGLSLPNGKRVNVKWSCIEDELLIRAWLNISKDSSAVDNPRNVPFWKRIDIYYNGNIKGFPKRRWRHLKDRWQRLSPAVFKFTECYDRIVQQEQHSSSSERSIMKAAHQLYKDNYGKSFTWEHAWECLKDEPKWIAKTQDSCKSRNVFHSEALSNPEMPANSKCDPTPLPLIHEMDQKPTETKVEEKIIEICNDNVDAQFKKKMQEIAERKAAALEKFAQAKEESVQTKRFLAEYEILMKDTSHMSVLQRKDHNIICEIIRKKIRAM